MLRRVNAALFEAPAGARIELVAISQNNNGVNDARFEYAGSILSRETILGLPGCSFTVQGSPGRLQAVVAFAGDAPRTARYDLAEVENGVQSTLGKFTLKSDASPLIDFAIDPVAVAPRAAAARTRQPSTGARTAAAPQASKKRMAKKKAVKKAATKKKTAKKRTAKKKTAKKRTAKKSARTASPRKAVPPRSASRKRR